MVTCPNCGHSLLISNYCIHCGKKMEKIRICKKCNNLYLKQFQTCPNCFTPKNQFSSPKFISYLMYFQSTIAIVFLLSSYFIIQMILGFCFFLFIPELNQTDTVISDTISLVIIIISNLFFILLLTKFSPYRFANREIGRWNLRVLIRIIGVFILSLSLLELSLVFINQLLDQLSLPPSLSSPYDGYFGNPLNMIIFSILVILVGPVFEEIIFRQHISSFLESNISSKIFVIFLSGIIFSMNHLPADLLNGSVRFTIEHLYVVFILGIVLGVIYYKYGLLYSIIFHSLWNTFSFLAQIENLLPDPVFLSNLLLILGLASIIILPGFLFFQNRKKMRNLRNYARLLLTSRKASLPAFTNAVSIITYELLMAILLVENQSVLSIILLLGINSLGLVLGFIVLEYDFKKYDNFQDQ
jgi:membrane protease YdiL (CAAX protease family)